MDAKSGERFTNARVHEWLTPDIDAITGATRTTRIQLNSAALWWFCRRLSAEQRAEILGEYMKVQAMGGRDPAALNGLPDLPAEPIPRMPQRGRPRRRKVAADV